MGNVQMEASMIRYGAGTVKSALDNGGGGGSSTASGVSYDNTSSHLTATNVQAAIDEMIVNFQDGVDDIYDACVAKGSTPSSHSLSDVITAIGNISGGGDILLYTIDTKSAVGTTAAITVAKYLNGVLQSSTDYAYADAGTPITIDNTLVIDYGVTSATNWTYKLLKASLLNHPVDYTKSWRYSDTVSWGENFSV